MSDKPLIVNIPEELLTRAQAANIDLRQTIIDALERLPLPPAAAHPVQPTRAEVEAAIQASAERLTSPDAPRRILGLHRGTISISDDFDAELPDLTPTPPV